MKYLLLILVFTLLIISFSAFLPFNFLLNFSHDDAFFYIKTADNFSKGLGSSFDGVNSTNGYHPLYFLLLSFYFYLIHLFSNPSPEVLYRAIFFADSILIGLTLMIIYRILKFTDNYKNKFFLFIPFFLILTVIRDFGLETHLLSLLFFIYLYFIIRENLYGINYFYLKLLIIPLIFLTRTDYLYSVIPFILASDYFLSRKENRKIYLITNLFFLILTALIYYSINYFFFGNISTISAVIVNTFPQIVLIENIKNLFLYKNQFINQLPRLLFVFSGLILQIYYWYKKFKLLPVKEKNIFIVFFISSIGSFVFLLLHLMFNANSIREWYLTLPTLITAFQLALLLNLKSKYFASLLIIFSLMFIIVLYFTRVQNDKFKSVYNYAKNLCNYVSENENIFQVDITGIVGFFSERKIVNGDGLINSFEYLSYLKSGDINKYLQKYKIRYYSTFSVDSTDFRGNYYFDKYLSRLKLNSNASFPLNDLIYSCDFSWNQFGYHKTGKWLLFKMNFQ
ncbi:MAG TPA: hypothetical protein VIL99_04720 [Ignavibacteria bacterium]